MSLTIVLMLACLAEVPAAQVDVPAAQIDAYVKAEMETRRVPGTSIAVVKDGRVVFERSYGLASIELAVPADESTVYELLSLSKQFTATAVLLLVEEGKLTLEHRITDLLEGLPASWKDVTVAQLLSHTSGIPDYTGQRGWFETVRTRRTPRDLLATVESLPLFFPPGSALRYSNSNYFLLGLVVEKQSGMSLDAFAAARIFEPLGMTSTRLESFDAIIAHRSAGYHATKEAVQNAPWVDPSHKWAAGAFVANVGDVAKWAVALDQKKLLRPATHDLMVEPAVLADGTKATYGLANELSVDHGHRVAGHQGGGMAFNATLLRYVDDHLSVIVLCNLTQAPSRTWARHIASLWIADLAKAPSAIPDRDPEFTAMFRRVLTEAARGKVDGEPFATEVRARMTAFIERVGPQFLGPMGDLESVTLVEPNEGPPNEGPSNEASNEAPNEGGAPRTLRYLASFRKDTVLWTVEVDRLGKIVSMEPEE